MCSESYFSPQIFRACIPLVRVPKLRFSSKYSGLLRFPQGLEILGDPNGRRARREGERIVRAKRDKNSPIAEIGHERAKWATATDGVKYPKNTPADESYLDEQPSYASNEVAINWNVTLFTLSAGIDALQ